MNHDHGTVFGMAQLAEARVEYPVALVGLVWKGVDCQFEDTLRNEFHAMRDHGNPQLKLYHAREYSCYLFVAGHVSVVLFLFSPRCSQLLTRVIAYWCRTMM